MNSKRILRAVIAIYLFMFFSCCKNDALDKSFTISGEKDILSQLKINVDLLKGSNNGNIETINYTIYDKGEQKSLLSKGVLSFIFYVNYNDSLYMTYQSDNKISALGLNKGAYFFNFSYADQDSIPIVKIHIGENGNNLNQAVYKLSPMDLEIDNPEKYK